ncbi:response regulator [Motilimonas sp. KMU-193]|uniref:response regulator n=1 Tax=Motilimonas sp. KMU-193 TaxID=3388668 RepID=UPI00396B3D1F
MKILIVDDSKAMQAIVKRSLKACGYGGCDIQLACDGVEALAIIKQWHPDIVLSDWYMPKMTGIELLEEVKRQRLEVKIGFVTSETEAVKLQQAKQAGARFVLTKPFTDEALYQAMLPLLDEEEQLPASATRSELIHLPNISALAIIFNAFAAKEVLLEAVPIGPFHSRWLPCFLAVFADSNKKVRAVAVIDFAGLAIIGACIEGIADQQLHEIIKKRAMPKGMMARINDVFKVLGTNLLDPITGEFLSLQSINYAAKSMPKLEKMFNKPAQERLDIELAVLGYGQGYLTLVCS